MHSYRITIIAAIVVFSCYSTGFAQSGGTVYDYRTQEDWGAAYEIVADQDGDGGEDLLWVERHSIHGGLAKISNARTRDRIVSFPAPPLDPPGFSGASARLDDLDQDGIADFALSSSHAGGVGVVHVYSSAGPTLLYSIEGTTPTHRFGIFLKNAGDADGDGHGDLFIMESLPNGRFMERLHLISGKDGSTIRIHGATSTRRPRSDHLATIGDLDGDGADDYILHSGNLWDEGPATAMIFSGKTGTLLHHHRVTEYWYDGGGGEHPGDVDLDGIPDYILRGTLYSGADFKKIHGFTHYRDEVESSFQVHAYAPAGDVDGDGIPDILLGDSRFEYYDRDWLGAVLICSGADGRALLNVAPWGEGAGHVVRSGDFNGNGRLEFYTHFEPTFYFDGLHHAFFGFEAHLHADTDRLRASNGEVVDLGVDFGFASTYADYAVWFSSKPVLAGGFQSALPLRPSVLLAKSQAGIYPSPHHAGMFGTLDAFGKATATILFPSGQHYNSIGRTIWAAAATLDAAGNVTRSSIPVPFEIVF